MMAALFRPERQNRKDRHSAVFLLHRFFRSVHLVFSDNKRDDTHPCKLVALFSPRYYRVVWQSSFPPGSLPGKGLRNPLSEVRPFSAVSSILPSFASDALIYRKHFTTAPSKAALRTASSLTDPAQNLGSFIFVNAALDYRFSFPTLKRTGISSLVTMCPFLNTGPFFLSFIICVMSWHKIHPSASSVLTNFMFLLPVLLFDTVLFFKT